MFEVEGVACVLPRTLLLELFRSMFYLLSQTFTLGKGAGTNFSLLVLFRFLGSWAASSFFWYSGHMVLLAV
jgi:hypothetical protein